jgi:GTP cyclohydrolase II
MTGEERLFMDRAKNPVRKIKALNEQVQQMDTLDDRIELHRQQERVYQILDDLFKSEVNRLQDDEAVKAQLSSVGHEVTG